MKYYVVADVHGYYTHLMDALENARFFAETAPHKLVICGDLMDRGGEARQMQAFVTRLLEEDRLIFIRGNHEDLMRRMLHDVEVGDMQYIKTGTSYHVSNGTWHTALQLAGMSNCRALQNPGKLVEKVKESPFWTTLIPASVDYFETEHYVFVHGWIPCTVRTEVIGGRKFDEYFYIDGWRDASEREWERARWFHGMYIACQQGVKVKDKTVVCGHIHASYGHANIEGVGSEHGKYADFTPFYGDGIIAIDGCTACSGMVNCIVIEDSAMNHSL